MNMSTNTEDPRTHRTKRDLKKALVCLMNEKPFPTITVTDIVSRAVYNRTTFYRHFSEKDDLINEYMNDILADLENAFRTPYTNTLSFDINDLTPKNVLIFQHIYRYVDFYRLYKNDKGPPVYQDRFIETIIKLYQQDFFWNDEDALFHTYRAYGIWGLILRWIKSDFSVSIDEMSYHLIQIHSYQPPNHYKVRSS